MVPVVDLNVFLSLLCGHCNACVNRINGTAGSRDNNGTGQRLVTKDRLVCVWGL